MRGMCADFCSSVPKSTSVGPMMPCVTENAVGTW